MIEPLWHSFFWFSSSGPAVKQEVIICASIAFVELILQKSYIIAAKKRRNGFVMCHCDMLHVIFFKLVYLLKYERSFFANIFFFILGFTWSLGGKHEFNGHTY